jgi:hypothetical protein
MKAQNVGWRKLGNSAKTGQSDDPKFSTSGRCPFVDLSELDIASSGESIAVFIQFRQVFELDS